MALANVALTDTFDILRTRTNQLIFLGEENAARITVAHGNTNVAYTVANSAFARANTVFAATNAAFSMANNANVMANAAYITANAAFGAANSITVGIGSAYDAANAGFSMANNANTMANAAYITANAAFAAANTGTAAVAAFGAANAAFSKANISSAIANAAFLNANTAFDKANSANSLALAAFIVANGANTMANAAYRAANGAFAHANAVNTIAYAAFATANAANQSALNANNANHLGGIAAANYIRQNTVAYTTNTHAGTIIYSTDNIAQSTHNQRVFRGASMSIFFQCTNANSMAIETSVNSMTIKRGANDSTTMTQVAGYWPAVFYSIDNSMTVGGEFRAVGDVFAKFSDGRLKENLEVIENALDKLDQIKGVYYTSNDLAKSFGYTDEGRQVGVLTQDVKKVLPEVIKPAPFDILWDDHNTKIIGSKSGENYETVQYDKLVPLLIEAIKELRREIEKLKKG